ncbi:MAG: phosphoribosyltransferase family protein [Alkalibacterium sp.]
MNKCLWCQGPVEMSIMFSQIMIEKPTQTLICSGCQLLLDRVADNKHKCLSCCKRSEAERCQDCLTWQLAHPDYLFKHESLYYYNDFAKEYLEKYKRMGDCELCCLFSNALREYFKVKQKHSVIVPIPTSEKSRAVRGFNQVELLLESAGVSYSRALMNIGEDEKQARKNKAERMKTKQPFKVDPKSLSLLEGKSVILVDDLYTTGRTLFHAAEALKNCHLKSLETFSLFR